MLMFDINGDVEVRACSGVPESRFGEVFSERGMVLAAIAFPTPCL
jgi:hypothetical protein